MKRRGLFRLMAFVAFVVLVSLACSALSSTPTSAPDSNSNLLPTKASEQPANNKSSSSSGPKTFTDQNDFYAIDLPGDWDYKQKNGDHYYIDQFKSPDGNALIENIAYDDGKPFTGSQNGKFALYLLNTFYSSTGKEGDIHVSDDSIQKDGSERLAWSSSGGGYSGLSYFEVRNRTTFLMFTVEYANDYENTYIDILNNVVASYRTP